MNVVFSVPLVAMSAKVQVTLLPEAVQPVPESKLKLLGKVTSKLTPLATLVPPFFTLMLMDALVFKEIEVGLAMASSRVKLAPMSKIWVLTLAVVTALELRSAAFATLVLNTIVPAVAGAVTGIVTEPLCPIAMLDKVHARLRVLAV